MTAAGRFNRFATFAARKAGRSSTFGLAALDTGISDRLE